MDNKYVQFIITTDWELKLNQIEVFADNEGENLKKDSRYEVRDENMVV